MKLFARRNKQVTVLHRLFDAINYRVLDPVNLAIPPPPLPAPPTPENLKPVQNHVFKIVSQTKHMFQKSTNCMAYGVLRLSLREALRSDNEKNIFDGLRRSLIIAARSFAHR